MVGITRSKVIFHSVGNFIIPTDFHSIIFQRGRRTNHQADIISYYSNINVDISHIIPYYLHIPTRYYTSSLGFFQATDLLSPGPAPGHQRHGLQTWPAPRQLRLGCADAPQGAMDFNLGKTRGKIGDWWCPSRFITPIAMVFVGAISIVNGINQLVIWGAPPCRCVQVTPISRWFMVDILTYWHTMVYKPTFHH